MATQFRFDVTVNVKQTPDGMYIASSSEFPMFIASRDEAQVRTMAFNAIESLRRYLLRLPPAE